MCNYSVCVINVDVITMMTAITCAITLAFIANINVKNSYFGLRVVSTKLPKRLGVPYHVILFLTYYHYSDLVLILLNKNSHGLVDFSIALK